MKKIILFPFIFQLCLVVSFAQIKVQNLLTENRTNPIGIDVQQPRFSWQLVSDKKNIIQSAYAIQVLSGKSVVWNSGTVEGSQSVQVAYSGAALKSNTKYAWRVQVWDNNGKPSAWSEPAFFQTALMNAGDGKAKWIEAGFQEDSVNRPAILFRRQFALNKKIASATLYITAHGMYEAQINGKRVGDAYLSPGWTSYNKRLQYQAYDVTNMLAGGNNVIGGTVGNGWYRGYLAWEDNKNIYGKKLGLLVQLEITYSNGKKETIIS